MLKRLRPRRLIRAPSPSRCTALAQDTIKIGEINSYKAQPAFLEPYKKGWELARRGGQCRRRRARQEARGDLARRQRQRRATRCASPRSWSSRERVALIAGTFLSNIGLAVTDFAKQKQGVLPRRRAAHRQDHLAERQPLHLPPAPQHLHAGRRCWCPRRPS